MPACRQAGSLKMRMDKMTAKLQEALQEAISLATESGISKLSPRI